MVWCDVLGWLQEEPDASAVALLSRLQSAHPDRSTARHVCVPCTQGAAVARHHGQKLIYGSTDEAVADPAAMPKLALVGSDPKC